MEALLSAISSILIEINTSDRVIRFHVLEKYGNLADTVVKGGDPQDCIAGINEAVADADLEFLSREVPDAVEQTLQGVNRVSGIVKSRKDFSHPGTEEKVALDINKALESTLILSQSARFFAASAPGNCCCKKCGNGDHVGGDKQVQGIVVRARPTYTSPETKVPVAPPKALATQRTPSSTP
ncbi:MAG: hypothetical protein R6U41_08230 [Desulfosalsimonas sp.]|uniref:hypothetical protein n=1 Tax=Desulfosalsimonas sp. TaxID=3073848 RepID=UPI003970ECCF